MSGDDVSRIKEAKILLRVALMQVAPSDDQIIVEHMRAALALLVEVKL